MNLNLLEQVDDNLRRINVHNSRLKVLEALVAANALVKRFVGIFSQAGTADPAVVELENSLGVTLTLARTSAGLYTITASEAVFTADKTIILGLAPDDATDDKHIGAVRTSDTVITISQAIATVATDVIVASTLSIIVYP